MPKLLIFSGPLFEGRAAPQFVDSANPFLGADVNATPAADLVYAVPVRDVNLGSRSNCASPPCRCAPDSDSGCPRHVRLQTSSDRIARLQRA
jgi:hypothetical protein